MKLEALNSNRVTVFNPCVTAGEKLTTEVGNAASDLMGIAHGNARADGVKVLRAPLGDAFEILKQLKTQFDLIVSAPPAGTVPMAGIPKLQKANSPLAALAAGVRKLVTAAPTAPTAVPEMDLGVAVWLVTNELLSPFGEAYLSVTPESHEIIKTDMRYSRVWLVVERKEPTHRIDLYLAADHRPPVGVSEPMRGEGFPSSAARQLIRGTTFTTYSGIGPAASKKFFTARDELQRRTAATATDFNLLLDANKIRVKFSEFDTLTGKIPHDVVMKADQIRGKTLMDLAVMRDTRDLTKAVLGDKRLRVADGLVAAFDDACKQIAILSAPFSRPSPVQRVAWLDESDTIQCVSDFATFKAGQNYSVRSETITGKKLEKRHRPGHSKPEDVLVTGPEVLIEIIDGEGSRHGFTQFALTPDAPCYGRYTTWHYNADGTRKVLAYTLNELVTHFAMPDVKDIAESDPASYLKYRNRLIALQEANS